MGRSFDVHIFHRPRFLILMNKGHSDSVGHGLYCQRLERQAESFSPTPHQNVYQKVVELQTLLVHSLITRLKLNIEGEFWAFFNLGPSQKSYILKIPAVLSL